MAQISLYIDDNTQRRLEEAARSQSLSVSKYVSILVKNHLDASWPADYGLLFGSIKDETFLPRSGIGIAQDVPRETLQ